MFNWKPEDQILRNDKVRFNIGRERVYTQETALTTQEKIEFLDKRTDGKFSYVLDLLNEFAKVKDSLPKDSWGAVKTTSLKAWIRKNVDQKRLYVDNDYQYGKLSICGVELKIQNGYRKGAYNIHENLIDEAFHKELGVCEREEIQWFNAHDSLSIKKKQIEEYGQQYHTSFNYHLIFSHGKEGLVIKVAKDDESFEGPEITEKQCDELLEKYKKVEELINLLSK